MRIALWFAWIGASPLLSSGQSVILDWDPSVDPTVTGYNLYYGLSSRGYTNVISTGTATTATVSGLTVGATYYFAVTSYDLAGLESDYSAEVSYTVPVPSNLPTLDPLSNMSLTENAGAQTINLSGISSGVVGSLLPIRLTASSSNPSVIANPVVSYSSPNSTGSLSFSAAPGAYGTAVLTVIVDNGLPLNNIFSRSFTVTVNNVAILQAAALSTQNHSLTISGVVGTSYQVQSCTNLGPNAVWLPVLTYVQTNAVQSVSVDATPSAVFYRVQQQ